MTLEEAVEQLRAEGASYDQLDQIAWDFLAEDADDATRSAFITYLLTRV